MHRRALHIASLFLLLASLGTAEATTLHNGTPAFAAPYIRILIAHQQAAAAAAQTALAAIPSEPPALSLPAAEQEQHTIVWTVRAPIAQTIAVHATSSSL